MMKLLLEEESVRPANENSKTGDGTLFPPGSKALRGSRAPAAPAVEAIEPEFEKVRWNDTKRTAIANRRYFPLNEGNSAEIP